MNVWEILGIQETDNNTEIRRAYAEQLKTHHPEDDPDGFQRLREAYEQVLKYTKIRVMIAAVKAAHETDETSDKVENKKDEADKENQHVPISPIIHLKEFTFRNPSGASRTVIKEFFESALDLYNDFYARIEIENWKKVLQAEQLWDMNLKEEIRWDVLQFFLEHPVLPQPVWHLLDSEFYWSEYTGYVPMDAKRNLSALFLEIDPYWNFDYSFVRREESIDYELYSEHRHKVKTAILEGDQAAASQHFDLAIKLYETDLKFFVKYYDYLNSIRGSDFFGPPLEERLQAANEMIDLCPDNPEYLIERANIYVEKSLYKEAIDEYRMLLLQYPDILEIPIRIMKIYEKTKNYFHEAFYVAHIVLKSPGIERRLKNKLAMTNGNRDVLIQIRTNECNLIEFKGSRRYKEHTDIFAIFSTILLLAAAAGAFFLYLLIKIVF